MKGLAGRMKSCNTCGCVRCGCNATSVTATLTLVGALAIAGVVAKQRRVKGKS